jgi:predicted membrane channel-forming protein YqfA (hemolysin III family)
MTEAFAKFKVSFIGDSTEAANFMQDNEFIKQGYRIDHNSCWQASKSLCTCHNETVNVWTHLAGALVFLGFFIGLAISIIPYRFEVGHDMMNNYSNQ